MTFNVKNLANTIGVRPGHDGDQVYLVGSAVNTTTTLYTVPADSVLLLDSFTAYVNAVSGSGACYAYIDGIAHSELYIMAIWYPKAALSDCKIGNFVPPLELIAGYRIRFVSTHADVTIGFSFKGILLSTSEGVI